MSPLTVTLIGGPTALIEYAGFRLLTDPTFDGPGEYQLPYTTLKKTSTPALRSDQVGAVDAVLLSHDQHWDNFDKSGRLFAANAPRVVTTAAGAKRLGGHAIGLLPWAGTELTKSDGRRLQVVATPARHGPAGIEPLSGDVIGFVLNAEGRPLVYITGDTTWFAGVAEVAKRYPAGAVLLFAGAAQTRGAINLTMNANDAIETAHAFSNATIVPIHADGWAHLTEDRADLETSFKTLGIGSRLQLLEPGVATPIRG